MLRERVSFPTSVLGLLSGRRAERSPAAIAAAVTSTSLRGLKLNRIINLDKNPTSKRTIKLIRRNNKVISCRVLSTPASETATTIEPRPDGSTWAIALVSAPSLLPFTVKGNPFVATTFAIV